MGKILRKSHAVPHNNMKLCAFRWIACAAVSAVLTLANSEFAVADEGDPPPQMGITLEPANSGQRSDGESIDFYTGKVQHEITDLLIPGNGSLELRVARAYNKNPFWGAGAPFGAMDWEVSVPRIYLAHPESDSWCRSAGRVPVHEWMSYETEYVYNPATGQYEYQSGWQTYTAYLPPTGVNLSIPGQQVRSLVKPPPQPADRPNK